MRTRYLALLALAGCGRIGFGSIADAPGSHDSVAADADPTCWSAWRAGVPALSLPAPVTSINTASYEDNAFVTADGLMLYFRSDRGGEPDFWYAKRNAPDADFAAVGVLTSLSSNGDEGTIQVTPDNHTAYISSTRTPSAGGYDVYTATRSGIADDFVVSGADFVNIETAGNEFDQQPIRGGARMYLASGGAMPDLYFADRPADGAPFAAPVAVPGVNSAASDFDPFVSPDELAILFTSDRAGSRDIYASRRDTTADPFDPPVALTAVNDASLEDQDLSLTADGCELWFSRPQPAGDTDLYTARVLP